ncbi:Dynamin, GTPase domain protein [Tolypocladium paradoxum]|uniref:Dynamin, GTPase domain protein n=1 Tax=Tolypocladium paradoxum TaxID=94208 RepID=A0A2S4L6Y8_9HYPO|nr:Dynamin, GTPase domain protein [Tolypocladium paradoxum]
MVGHTFPVGLLADLADREKDLLDAISGLHSLGVKVDNLPQIVVVGDTLSGKSSILRAISHIPFPPSSEFKTSFPIEVSLHRAQEEGFSVSIRDPDCDHQPLPSDNPFRLDDLPRIAKYAADIMGVGDDRLSVSDKTLRIDVSGPHLPSLTLVDLPGLCPLESKLHLNATAIKVLQMAKTYMKKSNTIIMPVISASTDLGCQTVLQMCRSVDPEGERTLGIITKLDTLSAWSPRSQQYRQLSRNKDGSHVLKHGWHVLSNGGAEEDGTVRARQAASEATRETTLPEDVESLQRSLRTIYAKQIRSILPTVIEMVENALGRLRESLRRLGKGRETGPEQIQYLFDIANNFRDIARCATRGTYDGRFFSESSQGDHNRGIDLRKLRAVIRALNRAFNVVMTLNGARRKIEWNDNRISADEGRLVDIPEALNAWVDLFNQEEPDKVTWANLKAELLMNALNNQGTQFPGSLNDGLSLDLFRDQSQNWKTIAQRHLDLILDATKGFVQSVIEHVIGGDEHIRNEILVGIVNPFFDQRTSELGHKLEELIRHYREGDAVCIEDEFRERAAQRRRTRHSIHVAGVLDSRAVELLSANTKLETSGPAFQALLSASGSGLTETDLESVVETMETHYEMSRRTFVDTVMILAVENCLISKIPSLLAPLTEHGLDPETRIRLTAEPATMSHDRVQLSEEIRALQDALLVCKKHLPWRVTRKHSFLQHGSSARNNPLTPALAFPSTLLNPTTQQSSSGTKGGAGGSPLLPRVAAQPVGWSLSFAPEAGCFGPSTVPSSSPALDTPTTMRTAQQSRGNGKCDSAGFLTRVPTDHMNRDWFIQNYRRDDPSIGQCQEASKSNGMHICFTDTYKGFSPEEVRLARW